jgi:hypothetical protein
VGAEYSSRVSCTSLAVAGRMIDDEWERIRKEETVAYI